jgi:ABC-type branched-subunit amino acid transport system substrate-binding protein
MSRFAKMAMILLAALMIFSIIGLGCSKKSTEEVTIKIGMIADLTGPASSFLRAGTYPAWEDVIRYTNEFDPVAPNVKLELVYYDEKYDPSLDVQAYDYLRQQGCLIIRTVIPPVGDSLRTFVDRDKQILFSDVASNVQVDPPGWIFSGSSLNGPMMKAFLNWVADNDWDYAAKGRKPRIGSVGWEEQYTIEANAAIKEYCDAHPDQFDLVAMRTTPFGTVSWTSEVEALKNCDYVYPGSIGVGISTFIQQYRAAGYKGKFFGNDALTAYKGLILGSVNWDQVDGTLVSHGTIWWSEKDQQIIKDATAMIDRYRRAQKPDILTTGAIGYCANFPTAVMFMDYLREAIKNAGGANKLTQQILYDTAEGFSWNQEGVVRDWTPTKRWCRDDIRIYRWDAATQDLVSVSGWVHNIYD